MNLWSSHFLYNFKNSITLVSLFSTTFWYIYGWTLICTLPYPLLFPIADHGSTYSLTIHASHTYVVPVPVFRILNMSPLPTSPATVSSSIRSPYISCHNSSSSLRFLGDIQNCAGYNSLYLSLLSATTLQGSFCLSTSVYRHNHVFLHLLL